MKATFRQAALAAALLAATAGAAVAQTATRVAVVTAPDGGAPAVTATSIAGAAAAVGTTSKETVINAVNHYFPHLPAHLEQPLTFVVGADGHVVSAERNPAHANQQVQTSAIEKMEVFKGRQGGIQVGGRYVDVIWITLKA